MIGVTENLASIREFLASATRDAKREPDAVKLLAVSKKQPLSKITAAAAAGQRDFGENFVQEGLEKISQTQGLDLVWHFIGHLQSNKTRVVAEHFQWVHTIDRIKIARRLSAQRPHYAGDLNVCIEVNVDAEANKSGVTPQDAHDLATEILSLPRLKLRGLMCIPAIRETFEEQREPFRALADLRDELAAGGIDLDTLSMGMTSDYAAAIREGATIVRIGTALFGARK